MTILDHPFPRDHGTELTTGLYRPVPPDPSGLRTAWVLFGISFAAGVYLRYFAYEVPFVFWLASILLLLVALGISLSHWLEGQTVLSVNDGGIRFETPLRKVEFAWSEIDELWGGKIRGGWKYMVSGLDAAFRFQSLVVIRSASGREVRSGFIEGQRLAQRIYQAAGLEELEQPDDIWIYRKKSHKQHG